ncbi:hypothetical protein EON65_36970 [archaeon]|nr:MAG: hypothetical protein EON65_36970 [archaeon]
MFAYLGLVLANGAFGGLRNGARKFLSRLSVLPSRRPLSSSCIMLPSLSVDRPIDALSSQAKHLIVPRKCLSVVRMSSEDNNAEVMETANAKYSTRDRFTAEEDEKLLSALSDFQKTKKIVSWKEVAEKVESKYNRQCASRWKYLVKYHPDKVVNIMADKADLYREIGWTDEEDERLLSAIRDSQRARRKISWKGVAEKKVRSRDKAQCVGRWHFLAKNYPDKVADIIVNKDVSFRESKAWTKEEDEKLLSSLRDYQKAKKKVSWLKLAENFGSREKFQCLSRWNNLVKYHPDKVADIMADKAVLFRSSDFHWTEKEDEKLLSTLRDFRKAKKKVSWMEVAETMGSRDKVQCTSRWQFLAKRHPDKVADIVADRAVLFSEPNTNWTDEEDEMSSSALREFPKARQSVSWKEVAAKMGSRDTGQCISRWNNLIKYQPDKLVDFAEDKANFFNSNFVYWTDDEDEKLLSALRDFQKARKLVSWLTVAEKVGSRDTVQCASRWRQLVKRHPDKVADITVDRSYLFKQLNANWTDEENEKLLSAIREFQKGKQRVSWVEVAEKVGLRTNDQCACHWNFLAKRHPDLVSDIVVDKGILFDVRNADWSEEEDNKLLSALIDFQQARQRVSWEEIAEKVGTRGSTQCHRRWNTLVKSHLQGI